MQLDAHQKNKVSKVPQICPFCYRKFKQIFRHRCQISPQDFSFKQPFLRNFSLFLFIYHKIDVFNPKTQFIDEYKLDRKKYQVSFIKLCLSLTQNPKSSYEQAWNDPKFSDSESILQFQSLLRHPAPQIIKKSYSSSKIQKVCPYCFEDFVRLDFHKCKKSPSGHSFRKFLGDDTFYKHLYQETNGWDERGFLTKSTIDQKKYTDLCSSIHFALIHNKDSQNINAEKILVRLLAQQRLKAEKKNLELEPAQHSSSFLSEVEFPSWDHFSHNFELSSPESDKDLAILLCPFCLHQITDFYGHSCKFKPFSFHFSDDLSSNLKFCMVAFRVLHALDSNGCFDIYLLNRTHYLQVFLKYYNVIFFPQQKIEKQSTSTEIFQPSIPLDIHKNQFAKKVQEKLNFYERLYLNQKKIKQVCPFCIVQYNDLSSHDCQNIPENYPPDFTFQKNICTDWFFVYLYQNVGIWNRSGKVDVFKLNSNIYLSLFEECYTYLTTSETPLLTDLISKRYEAELLQQEKEKQIVAAKERSDAKQKKIPINQGTVIQQLCPWCFSLFPSLYLHQCVERPLNFSPQFEFQDITSDDFFFHLYFTSDGLTKTNQIDLYRINRQKYHKEFFKAYEEYFIKLSRDLQKKHNLQDVEENLDVIEELNIQVDAEFEDLDVLELLSKDIDIASPKSKQQKNEEGPILETGIPWCFVCKNMMNCPKGVDSQQMESIFECELFISQDIAEIEQPVEKSFTKKPNKKVSKPQSKEETNALILEIMKKWETTRGKLDIYCSKCETEMKKIVTSTKEFYRCNNYPECNITADPWYIKRAVESGIFSHKEHGDLLILFKYNKTKNIVLVSQIFSEGKLFL